MARPQIHIDMEELDKLIEFQATAEEIAGWFECSVDTIERRIKEHYDCGFAEYFAQKKGKGKLSLRRKQYQEAMKGNTTLLIWLGKQYLGQTEKQELDIEQKTIQINIDKDDNDL